MFHLVSPVSFHEFLGHRVVCGGWYCVCVFVGFLWLVFLLFFFFAGFLVGAGAPEILKQWLSIRKTKQNKQTPGQHPLLPCHVLQKYRANEQMRK